MKTEVIEYSCKIQGSKIELRLEYFLVADYPISFTVEECLEEFCESAGWEFLKYGHSCISGIYIFHCLVPTGSLIMDTICNEADEYRRQHENY